MVDILVSFAAKLAENLVALVVPQLGCHERNFKKLEDEVERLKRARDKVQHKVDDAKNNVEEIEQNVKKWQDTVNKFIDEAVQFIEEKKAKNRCFNWLSSYKHSGEVTERLNEVASLLQEEKEFDKVSYRNILEEIWLTSNNGYEAFESRKSTLMNILNALNEANTNIIGVYGMGGIGKTTLAKAVARQAKKHKLFDKVAFAEVSDTPDVKKIQEKIADELGLEFIKESERARKLHARLKNEKKILIILDNIWEDMDLEMIGIPYGTDHGGCKILMTARDRNVLDGMGCKTFLLGFLNEDEGWSLFKKMAGDCIENHEFKSIAIDVVKECGGLPIALVTVGKALRKKSLFVWKDALRELRMPSPPNFKGRVLEKVYSKIEFSYNNLNDEELKKTFLLCSRIGFTYDILVADLFKYGLGLGLFHGTTSMEEARCRVHKLVDKLKESCLLLDNGNDEFFSMHDVVREVALSIACRDEHAFTVRNEFVPMELLNKDTLKNCTAISLPNINITVELPQDLECPQLKFFLMDPKDSFLKIPENFFTGMKELRVLDLTGMHLLSLPSSIYLLINLQTLCLDFCVLKDIAGIGNLKNLEILSLLYSDIVELPEEIAQLTRLRLLDLTYCSKLKVILPNVISSLCQLEELYMGDTFIQWEIEGRNIKRSNASLEELKHLSKLANLEISMKDAEILPESFFSRKLNRYKILIGNEWKWFTKSKTSRTLKLKLNSSICLKELQGIKNGEDLYLDKLQGIKNVLYELDGDGFSKLKHLHVQNNPNFLSIVESIECISCDAFPLLESMFLHNLINLEKICHGPLTALSFCKLKIMKVSRCNKLKDIFSISMARCLLQLQTIEVTDCKNMEEIFAIRREDNINNIKVIDKIEFSDLHSLTLKILPQFRSLYSIVEDDLDIATSLFNEKVVFPNLEALELSAINFEKIWLNQFPAAMSYCVQNLRRLIVQGCNKLKYIFSSSTARYFVKLQHLEISKCAVLEEIVTKEGEEATVRFVFPQVTSLVLCKLPELRTFYSGVHTSEWPVLKKLEVYGCEKVKTFTSELFSFQEADDECQLGISIQHPLFLVEKVCPNLEELILTGKDIKLIWHGQFPDDLFGKLKVLEVVNDESVVFPLGFLQRIHNLEELALHMSSYKVIFSYPEVEKHFRLLTQIKSLVLCELSDMKDIWKQGLSLGSILHNLETLHVEDCDNLINLVPSAASFQNLTTLNVKSCNGLINLLTSSTARSLVQLTEMNIYGCKMMTEILANEGDVAKDEIIFRKLKWLSLERLRSLSSFCSGNYTLNFPSLKYLAVRKCPNMKIFFQGDLITAKLQKILLSFDDEYWEGDLNSTIQQLHKKMAEDPETEDEEDSETPMFEVDDEEEDEDSSGEYE